MCIQADVFEGGIFLVRISEGLIRFIDRLVIKFGLGHDGFFVKNLNGDLGLFLKRSMKDVMTI